MSAEKNITRKDVAEKAGVSVSVVSRVLNNSGYVDKEKKKKIIKIAEQLGYAYSARTAHPFQRNGAPFRFKLSKAQQVD